MADELLAGHGRFRSGYAASQQELLARLQREGQRPSTVYIGCSDSRVIPELLTDAAPGDLFVVRNVANRVPARGVLDTSVGSALEYAIGQLGVKDVVVCGHDECGGVTAAYDDLDGIPSDSDLARWLADLEVPVKRVQAMGLERMAALRRAVEESVLDSLANLLTYESVRARVAAGDVRLHAWVYRLADGDLRAYDKKADAFIPSASSRSRDPTRQ